MGEDRVAVYVVGEDQVHRVLAMALVDATISWLAHHRSSDWVEARHVRRWSALEESDQEPEDQRWGDIHRRPKVRFHGYLDGRPCLPAARKFRASLVEHARADRPPGLVVIMQDTDGDERIIDGARQVLEWAASQPDLPPVVIGTPHRDAEGWFLAAPGIRTRRPDRVERAQKVLSFDPTRHPERLTARPNAAVTDAKRVLRFVLLQEGDDLAPGRPASRSPTPDEAERLASELVADLDALESFDACRLGPFVIALRDAVVRALSDHLRPVA